jgi:hypothetical protein
MIFDNFLILMYNLNFRLILNYFYFHFKKDLVNNVIYHFIVIVFLIEFIYLNYQVLSPPIINYY